MKPLTLMASGLLAALACAQDRLPFLPGYAEYAANRGKARPLLKLAPLGSWTDADNYRLTFNGKTLTYTRSTSAVTTTGGTDPEPVPVPQARGRQVAEVSSVDGKVASYKDGNITLTLPDGTKTQITTDGSIEKRIKYGTASWVYGEELEQRDAMGFSPDGTKLWYFRFDEGQVLDSYFLLKQRSAQPTLGVEAFPKPGHPNPAVDIFIYDVAAKKSVKVQLRPGAFDDALGHYAYAAAWRKDSKALLFHRMDRRQQEMELCAADPATGAVKVLDRQVNKVGWVEYVPLWAYTNHEWALGDDKLLSFFEDSGYFNIGVVDVVNGGRKMLTSHKFDVLRVLRVDKATNTIDYMTDNPDKPYHQQLWRMNLDGSGDHRITDPTKHHTVSISPDGKTIADRAETPSEAPVVQILDADGKVLKVLAQSDTSAFTQAGYQPEEWVKFKADDGTDLYGRLGKPKNFDPKKKYPVIFSVYGGPLPPHWGSPSANYQVPGDMTNLGFLWVEIMQRDGQGRGRAFRQAIYKKMGGPEIDDMAALARELIKRPYVDATKIGIEGTSYGGYASATALLRYPDLFAAACSCSPVTDYRYYDTTYTERYMGLLEDNVAGYDAGSCIKLAPNLKGRLLLYFGTADDNVHQNNTLSLVEAFRRARKNIEVQVGTDFGHSGIDNERMMEFFIERMVMENPRLPVSK